MLDNDNEMIEQRILKAVDRAGYSAEPITQAMELLSLVNDNQRTHADMTCLVQAESMLFTMLSLEVDEALLVATLIYPFAQYAGLPTDSIATVCDQQVVMLIKDAHKIHDLGELSQWQKKHTPISANQSEAMRKMLLAMISDVRAVVMRLVEQLTILSHCKKQPDDVRRQYAEETKILFVPLANRLGLRQIKWQLEDYVLRYLEPKTYQSISQSLNQRRSDRERYVKQILQQLRQRCESEDISIQNISGRAKHINSIYQKMQRKQKSFSEIYDMIATRIIVQSVDECYHVLSIINEMWAPIETEFDDYIVAPKPNGYQSIHTAVIGPEERLVEIQIRTNDMDKTAEYGVAAHWLYKESTQESTQLAATTTWLNQLIDWQSDLISNESSTVKPLRLFQDRVFVFTPGGEVKDLIKGATPIDFAYAIHTDVGHRCSGALVNNKIVPLHAPLKNGDRVEILTNKQGYPSRDWLTSEKGYIKTTRAKAKVQHWFRLQEESRHRKLGVDLVERGLKRSGISRRNIEQLAKEAGYPQVDALYISLGRGEVSIDGLLRNFPKVTANHETLEPQPEPTVDNKRSRSQPGKSKSLIQADGLESILSFIAQCCKPIPGDEIIGYITRGRGLAIHQAMCPNITRLSDDLRQRCVSVSWQTNSQTTFLVDFSILTEDKNILIHDLTIWLSLHKIVLQSLRAHESDQGSCRIDLTLELRDIGQVKHVINQLRLLPKVIGVTRISNQSNE